MGDGFAIGVAFGAGGVFLLFAMAGCGYFFIRPWLTVKLQGGHISMLNILGMHLRGTPVKLITDTYTSLLQRGVPVDVRRIESQYIAYQASIASPRDLIDRVLEHLQQDEQSERQYAAKLAQREEQWRREQAGD